MTANGQVPEPSRHLPVPYGLTLKVVDPKGAVIASRPHTAVLETDVRIRTDTGLCGRASRPTLCPVDDPHAALHVCFRPIAVTTLARLLERTGRCRTCSLACCPPLSIFLSLLNTTPSLVTRSRTRRPGQPPNYRLLVGANVPGEAPKITRYHRSRSSVNSPGDSQPFTQTTCLRV
ncbi:MAG: hypothetical protein HW416_2389 [Chloroflexi bacterium]|nr:hypothetical protein [Chloroflexota bacterium]